MNKILAVDVDDTVVNPNWKQYLDDKKGCYTCILDDEGNNVKHLPFALGEFYKGFNISFDPYDFWRSETLYDNLEPIEGSVESLQELSTYFDIVFVSRLKGHHHSSKVKFLKKHFPFMTGFIGTHEKWILNNSVIALIDDQQYNLKGFDLEKRICFNGQYTQKEECEVVHGFDVWDYRIVDKIIKMFGDQE